MGGLGVLLRLPFFVNIMTEPVTLFSQTNDARHWSPKQSLEQGLKDLEDRDFNPNKSITIFLDTKDGDYKVSFVQSGLSMSELLALLKVMESVALDKMGF